ncbi:cyclin-dependent kinase 4 inhibitor B [Crotalus adamanteus]|uniref:Cyclin-dependent kinase 4 inhibitor B n=1 Tax=Crotalus adamanteus TaxID=8729 RepID=A0AAW1C1Z8_CROAD
MEAPNRDNCQANQLANAAARGDLETVAGLLGSGADPNAINGFGRTPIQVMMMGSARMAELLLQRGADPNRPDPSTGATPAHDLAQEGFLDTLMILHHWGARFDQLDRWGHSPLDLARQNGQNHVVDYLQELSG